MVLLFVFLLVVGSVSSTVLIKNSSSPIDARTLYVGGSGPGNYSRIQDAVDNASTGDTVFVYSASAPYYENIAIHTSIYLIGENRETTSIEGGNHAVWIYAPGVTVSGFRISNVGDFWNCAGFYITSDGNNISNNNIVNNLRMNGVYLYDSSYNTIVGNHIENNDYHGMRVEYSSHNIIANNTIVNVRGYGIDLAESTDNLIYGNTVQQCFWGGLVLDNMSTSNTFYHNNFINNSQNGFDPAEGNVWDNGSAGNYWDDYHGSDANGDGIGDTPYQIPGNISQDRYPLMKPYGQRPMDIIIHIEGGFGLTITLTNNGTQEVNDVYWYANVSGGLVVVPSARYYIGIVPSLLPGQAVWMVRWMVGLGVIEVKVTVGDTTASMRGLLLFFYLIPLSVN